MRSIERALASQRFAAILPAGTIFPSRILLTDQHAQQRIVPELVMVVEVFISQRQSVNPLGDQVVDRMLDRFGITVIGQVIAYKADRRNTTG